MTFLLLIKGQTRLSWVVIAAAVVALAAGVSLLVYFYKRYKKIEKETEDDWDASRHSLFVRPPTPRPKTESAEMRAPVEIEPPMPAEESGRAGGTREFAGDLNLPSFAQATIVETQPQAETQAPEETIPVQTPVSPEPRATEVLASPSIKPPTSEALPEITPTLPETAPLEEDVWAGVEVYEQDVVSRPTEPLTVARVEERVHKESFETPRSERIAHREPYEPPMIEPLTPRDAAATRELRSPRSLAVEQPEEPKSQGTVRLGSVSEQVPKPLDSPPAPRETRELAGEPAATAAVIIPPKPVSAGVAAKGRSFGSVLGLPTESSHQPLILGKQVRPADETGIGALTHYGQDLGPKGGRAGKIILFLVVALLLGGAGMYYFVPSVHSRVGDFIARLRGAETQERDALKPKAQIMPSSRPEVNKNLVTARGAVDNISDEPLTGLEVEVSLRRGDDAPPEIRRIPVTPDPLPPGERGAFEFEYDGKRDTGFAGYTITKLFSNGVEMRFRTPAQK